MRTMRLVASCALAATVLAACSSGSSTSTSSSAGTVTLTLWHNYGTEANAVATTNLVKAFESAHPNIRIKVISQPASNYFSLLQASAISRTGPDLAVMWTGLFALKYKKFLVNLKGRLPAADLARLGGMQWSAPGFDSANGSYVVPLEDQFYIGFYNKALFRKVGITAPPRTWSELFRDCATFKAAGITCLYYGSGSQNLGSVFYPWYDMSYLMIGALQRSQWIDLYSGRLAWDSPQVQAQVATWHRLYTDGYTNRNALTAINSLTTFQAGKAAMLIKGNWDLAQLQSAMGANLGVFVPPFSNTPINGVVQYPGDGFSMTTYARHPTQALQFLSFLTTTQAAQIIDKAGLIPDLKGYTPANPLEQQMLGFAGKQGMSQYPMLDNVIQPDVVDAGSKQLPAILTGQVSVSGGLAQLRQALTNLPADQRGSSYR